ncbi:MAG TPA: PIN domain protein [bacterium]|nr:PIN domain protein [bacterium]HQL64074.1 PIN domain protein [bacterium]
MKRKTRIYADTSVFGGVADEEFNAIAFRFFEEVRAGRHVLIVSEITARELQDAPLVIRRFVAGLPEDAMENLPFTPEMLELRDAYLSAKVVGRRWGDDAAHVAAATVTHADLIVSWNFRHIVNWDKIRAFNAVNLRLGYPLMTILSPREVITYEENL